jgi:hypothetical protein
MSDKILSSIYIGNGQTQGWVATWNSAEWQGDTFVQPEPLTPEALMSYTDPEVSLTFNGSFSFTFSVTNKGPVSGFYNLQLMSG